MNMIYKYILSISGDSLYPKEIIDKIRGDFIIDDYFSPFDVKKYNQNETYEYGSITFFHPNKFSTKDEIVDYEKLFIKFLRDNRSIFMNNNVKQIEIYMEIYFNGEQCNFEIFDRCILKELTEFNISLPISVYVMKDDEILNWEKEIKLLW